MSPPRGLDAGALQAKLRLVEQLLDDLDAVGPVDADRLHSDRMLRYAVERVLTQLVELAAGVNGHLLAVRSSVVAPSYRESFLLLAQAGVLTAELAARLAPSAGLRNVLVHEYLEVDLALVAEGARLAVDAYRAYVRQVAAALLQG